MRYVLLLCGPPGAGKTTLAKSLGLTVYDRDDPSWRDEAHFTRAIRQLASNPVAQAAVIRAGASSTSRKRTATIIRATEVQVLAVDADTCIRRVLSRGRAGADREVAAVRRWWRIYQRNANYSAEQALADRQRRYGPDFQAERRTWKPIVESGAARCSEPVCLAPARQIRPDEPWDLSHDPTGEHVIGPSHRRCNRAEAARRGNARRGSDDPPRRLIL